MPIIYQGILLKVTSNNGWYLLKYSLKNKSMVLQVVQLSWLNEAIQFCEGIHKIERRRLSNVASSVEQTCFVGSTARLLLRVDEVPSSNVSPASGGMQGSPHLKLVSKKW